MFQVAVYDFSLFKNDVFRIANTSFYLVGYISVGAAKILILVFTPHKTPHFESGFWKMTFSVFASEKIQRQQHTLPRWPLVVRKRRIRHGAGE